MSRLRTWRTILLAVTMLVALTVAAGSATAHNPACHQVAVQDGSAGPHYDGEDGTQTASQTAFEKNKNLGGDAHPDHSNARGGCDAGEPRSAHSDN